MKRFLICMLCLLLCGAMLFGCAPAEEPAPETDDQTQPEPEPEVQPEPEPEPEPEPQKTEFRIVMSPDIHCTRLLQWNGLTTEERIQLWVDAVLAEHEKDPIDLLILLGDLSLDHWFNGGAWLRDGESDTEILIWDYVIDQLPSEIQVFAIPGNHEQFSNADWNTITGNDRQGYVVMDDNLIFFLDTFAGELDPDHDHDGQYTGVDMEFVNEVVAQHPKKDIWIFAHFVHLPYESEEFKEFLRTNQYVMAIFHGHEHTLTVQDLGDEYNNVPLIMCGQFSYTNSSNKLNQNYSFRELILDDDGNNCGYVIAEIDFKEKVLIDTEVVMDVEFY